MTHVGRFKYVILSYTPPYQKNMFFQDSLQQKSVYTVQNQWCIPIIQFLWCLYLHTDWLFRMRLVPPFNKNSGNSFAKPKKGVNHIWGYLGILTLGEHSEDHPSE